MRRQLLRRLEALERRTAPEATPFLSIRLVDVDADGCWHKPWEHDPALERAYRRRDALRQAQPQTGIPDYLKSINDLSYAWLAALAMAEPAFLSVACTYCTPEDWRYVVHATRQGE